LKNLVGDFFANAAFFKKTLLQNVKTLAILKNLLRDIEEGGAVSPRTVPHPDFYCWYQLKVSE
jgi:hypothetical protein